MSVCAALIHKKTVYIATDSRISQGDTYRDLPMDKFLDLTDEDVLIAICGEMRQEQIIERFLQNIENAHLLIIPNLEAVHQLVDGIHERLKTAYNNEHLNNMNDTHLLIVSKASKYIYVVDPDFSISAYLDHASIGSGGDVCEAALDTAARCGKTGKAALKLAMEVACGRISSCGGKIHTKTLELE